MGYITIDSKSKENRMDTIVPTLIKKLRDKLQLMFALMLIIMAGLWCAGLKNTRPIIHFETKTFLAFYGNPTGGFWSEVAKFFDPSPTDWDNYQARELGYVFEYIDARMVILLNKIPFFSYGFRSISLISFAILTSVVLYLIARELFPTFRRTSCLVLAMLFPLSTQMLAMQAEYFRCGKTVTAFWAALWILCLIHWLKPVARRPNVLAYMLLGLGAFLSFITDKQAVMIGLWLIGLSLMMAGIRRYQNQTHRHLIFFAASFTAAFCFYLYWDYQLCPYIIKAVRGYPPDRSWSSLSFFLNHDHASYIKGLWNGLKLTVLQIQLAFGNVWDGNLLSWGVALAAYILVALAAIKKSPNTPEGAIGDSRRGLTDRTALATVLVTALLTCIFMIMLLYMRHNPLAWEDLWKGGYYYQSATLFLIVALLIVFSFLSRRNRSRRFETYIVCAVFLMCMANNLGLDKTRGYGWGYGHMKEQIDLNRTYDQEIRAKQVNENSSFLMRFIFAAASERRELYKARQSHNVGVNLKILKNDDQLWPEEGWAHSKNNADRPQHDVKAEVESGDKLYFLVNRHQGMGFDTAYWDPVITYDDGATFKASQGFSGTQGKNGWHYQYKDGETYASLVYDNRYETWKHNGFPLLKATRQRPGFETESARVFVAPKHGTVRVTGAPVCVKSP